MGCAVNRAVDQDTKFDADCTLLHKLYFIGNAVAFLTFSPTYSTFVFLFLLQHQIDFQGMIKSTISDNASWIWLSEMHMRSQSRTTMVHDCAGRSG